MSSMTIIHLSDLHFGGKVSEFSPDEALELVGEALAEIDNDQPKLLLISGDITTKGLVGGFHEALAALQAKVLNKIDFSKVMVCPGNHDIVNSDVHFRDFNKFAFDLTGDSNQTWNSSRTIVVTSCDGYDFFLVNSSFHGDYSYGKTPLRDLDRALSASRSKNKIIVVHHSPISSAYAGGGLADAYDLLALASRHEVTALLHGHVHSDQCITIGKRPTVLAGVGSVSFTPDPNMNNQFSRITIHDGQIKEAFLYKYQANRRKFIAEELDF